MAGLCKPCCNGGDDAEPQSLPLADPMKEETEVDERQIAAIKLENIRVEKEGRYEPSPTSTTPEPEEPPKEVEKPEPKEEKEPETQEPAPPPTAPQAPEEQPPKTTKWVYKPVNGKMIEVRTEPKIVGDKAGSRLMPGQDFDVCEEKRDEQNVLFLKLADRPGWVFDHKPGVGIMCLRKEEADALEAQQQQQREEQQSQNLSCEAPGPASAGLPETSEEKKNKGCKCTVQ